MTLSSRSAGDEFLVLSDTIEQAIDAAQEHHINGNLREAQTKLRIAIRYIDSLIELERQP